MANTTLFYNVSPQNAGAFKTSKSADKVIGFVAPDPQNADDFGYLLAGGKQYGASKAQIEALITSKAGKPTVSDTSATFIDKDGNEISLAVDANGALTLSKYTAASWDVLTVTDATENHTSQTVEYGASYTISASTSLGTTNTITYYINPGTETISNRSLTAYLGENAINYALSANSGIVVLDTSALRTSETKSGYATAATSISSASNLLLVDGTCNAGERQLNASARTEITSTASLTVQHRWVQHTADIFVTTAGTPTAANGETFISGTVTNGTVNYVNVGSKPSSFTATNGAKCYLAFKASWGTPSFTDPSNFTNTAWKKVSSLSIYRADDYDVWVFVDVNQEPVAMNAAGAGKWKVAFK